MVLAAKKPRMVRQLHDLDQGIVRRGPGRLKAPFLQRWTIVIVYLQSMTMAFGNAAAAVQRSGQRAGPNHTWIRSQAHGGTLFVDIALTFHKVDHSVGCIWIDFARVRTLDSQHVAGVLDHHHLHPEADSQDWD